MVCLALMLGFRTLGMLNGRGSAYARTPTPLWGIHEVESFTSDGVERPPLTTDASRWRVLVIERSGLASVRFMDDSVQDYLTSVDMDAAIVTFVQNPDTTVTTAGATRLAYDPNIIEDRFEQAMEEGSAGTFVLGFSRSPGGSLTLDGQWGNSAIEVRTARADGSDFPLLNRGLRWVQYSPYFR